MTACDDRDIKRTKGDPTLPPYLMHLLGDIISPKEKSPDDALFTFSHPDECYDELLKNGITVFHLIDDNASKLMEHFNKDRKPESQVM